MILSIPNCAWSLVEQTWYMFVMQVLQEEGITASLNSRDPKIAFCHGTHPTLSHLAS